MKDMRQLAIVVICIGIISLVIGVIEKFLGIDIPYLIPRSFALFTGICFLLSINLLLLDKKS
ncbi:MAG: hypothetical protein JW943_17355 [Deltaproteobacteria bacterium]|nr:hypothetical protein [Deltaproteobacteria bacterium]